MRWMSDPRLRRRLRRVQTCPLASLSLSSKECALKHARLCNLHSTMLSHEAMRRLFDVSQDRSLLGNFAPLPAIYSKNAAPIVLIEGDGRRCLKSSSWGFLTLKKSKKTGNWIKPAAWNNPRDDKGRTPPLWKNSFLERRYLIFWERTSKIVVSDNSIGLPSFL